MLAISIPITWQPTEDDDDCKEVQSFGVLELAWLLGQPGEISKIPGQLATVNSPDLASLREKGQELRQQLVK